MCFTAVQKLQARVCRHTAIKNMHMQTTLPLSVSLPLFLSLILTFFPRARPCLPLRLPAFLRSDTACLMLLELRPAFATMDRRPTWLKRGSTQCPLVGGGLDTGKAAPLTAHTDSYTFGQEASMAMEVNRRGWPALETASCRGIWLLLG